MQPTSNYGQEDTKRLTKKLTFHRLRTLDDILLRTLDDILPRTLDDILMRDQHLLILVQLWQLQKKNSSRSVQDTEKREKTGLEPTTRSTNRIESNQNHPRCEFLLSNGNGASGRCSGRAEIGTGGLPRGRAGQPW